MRSALVSKFCLATVMLLCLVAATVGFVLVPNSAEAQPWASVQIEQTQWLGADHEGFDAFYGQDIVAYKAGDTAVLTAVVWNGFDSDVTVNYARLRFGWGSEDIAATASSPTRIPKSSYALFEWQYVLPATTNLIPHTWEIKVKCTVEAATPFDVEDSTGGPNFVVYSADQAECGNQVEIWEANNQAYTIWGYKGREMMTEAVLSYNQGEELYNAGKFEDAKNSFTDAVTKQDEAIKADAKIAMTDQTAESLRGTLGSKGIGYMIAGIGILVAGIGVMAGALLWVFKGKKAG